MGLMKQK